MFLHICSVRKYGIHTNLDYLVSKTINSTDRISTVIFNDVYETAVKNIYFYLMN